MSSDDYKPSNPPELSKRRKFENKLTSPIEIYITLGSTFYFLPGFTFDIYRPDRLLGLGRIKAEFAIDWLWCHIGIIID
jgi:hypothetical protein